MAKKAQKGAGSRAARQKAPENSQSSVSGTSNLFKDMSNSVEKRRDRRRQELRRKHRSQAKKTEESIRDAFRVDKTAFDEYRSSRMGKLSELVKKRSELEVKIITLLQSTRDTYETVNSAMGVSLEKRLAGLR